MLHFNNKDQYTQFAANLNKWVDKAIKEHQEESKQTKTNKMKNNSIQFNPIEWEQVRKDAKLPETDQNEGFIFGYEIVQNDEILDIEWYKTKEERDQAIQEETNANTY